MSRVVARWPVGRPSPSAAGSSSCPRWWMASKRKPNSMSPGMSPTRPGRRRGIWRASPLRVVDRREPLLELGRVALVSGDGFATDRRSGFGAWLTSPCSRARTRRGVRSRAATRCRRPTSIAGAAGSPAWSAGTAFRTRMNRGFLGRKAHAEILAEILHERFLLRHRTGRQDRRIIS